MSFLYNKLLSIEMESEVWCIITIEIREVKLMNPGHW